MSSVASIRRSRARVIQCLTWFVDQFCVFDKHDREFLRSACPCAERCIGVAIVVPPSIVRREPRGARRNRRRRHGRRIMLRRRPVVRANADIIRRLRGIRRRDVQRIGHAIARCVSGGAPTIVIRRSSGCINQRNTIARHGLTFACDQNRSKQPDELNPDHETSTASGVGRPDLTGLVCSAADRPIRQSGRTSGSMQTGVLVDQEIR